jgi:hypothetical protein
VAGYWCAAEHPERGLPCDLCTISEDLPPYSADTGAAWLVVERVQALHPGWRFSLLGGDVSFGYKPRPRGTDSYVVDKSRREAFGWRASFFGDEDPTQNYGQRHADEGGDTPALAICRAALAAVETLHV